MEQIKFNELFGSKSFKPGGSVARTLLNKNIGPEIIGAGNPINNTGGISGAAPPNVEVANTASQNGLKPRPKMKGLVTTIVLIAGALIIVGGIIYIFNDNQPNQSNHKN